MDSISYGAGYVIGTIVMWSLIFVGLYWIYRLVKMTAREAGVFALAEKVKDPLSGKEQPKDQIENGW